MVTSTRLEHCVEKCIYQHLCSFDNAKPLIAVCAPAKLLQKGECKEYGFISYAANTLPCTLAVRFETGYTGHSLGSMAYIVTLLRSCAL